MKLKAPYNEFKQNMTKLCIAYKHTIPLDVLNATYKEYYNSPLGDLKTKRFAQLIDKAKACLVVRFGIPLIAELVALMATLEKEKYDPSKFKKCDKCENGFITLVSPHGYESGFICDCDLAKFKRENTTIGRAAAHYKQALAKGYKPKTKESIDNLNEKQKERAISFINKHVRRRR